MINCFTLFIFSFNNEQDYLSLQYRNSIISTYAIFLLFLQYPIKPMIVLFSISQTLCSQNPFYTTVIFTNRGTNLLNGKRNRTASRLTSERVFRKYKLERKCNIGSTSNSLNAYRYVHKCHRPT